MNKPLEVLVAVDPGVVKLGLAVFVDGTLVYARTLISSDPLSAAQAVVSTVGDVVEKAAQPRLGVRKGRAKTRVRWTIEKMVKRDDFGTAHADLDAVEHTVELLLAEAKASRLGGVAARVIPEHWKGQVPKAVCDYRIKGANGRWPGSLSAAELAALLDNNHDTMDAVGIGLVRLGRLGVGCVPGKSP